VVAYSLTYASDFAILAALLLILDDHYVPPYESLALVICYNEFFPLVSLVVLRGATGFGDTFER
jgi:hypothetical protein